MKTKIALVFVLSTIPLARTKANQMPVSPTPLVSILPATPANLPLLDSGVVAKFHPNAFILANNSDRGIVGLVVQWRFTDASGKERTSLVRTDSFMQAANSGPIIAPHTRLLAAPGAFINEGTLGKQRIGMPIEKMDGTRDNQSITEGATEIAATIDMIIFDDGQVLGPNTTSFDNELTNRKLAATMVAKQLRNSIARGEDPTVTIGHIAKSTPANDDTFGVWTVRYAKMLSRQFPSGHPTLEEQLQTLENLPEPPSFHR